MCGLCPQLGSDSKHDLSARQWRRKRRWPTGRLTIIAPSRWIAGLAAESALFQKSDIRHIRTGVDLTLFKPCSKEEARQRLGLPLDRRLVLFGANNAVGNERKGFSHLIDALEALAGDDRLPDVDLVLFGSDLEPDLPLDIPRHVMGVIDDEAKMALLYGAADLFVTPSLEENLPNTVIEAMASGTPAVAFDVGGTGELIEHGVTGCLATAGDSKDLARGLSAVLKETLVDGAMGRRARDAMVATHDQRMIAKRYSDLYNEIHDEALEAS
jgi:glycosyltransferase involved in cell wall biosynthesis